MVINDGRYPSFALFFRDSRAEEIAYSPAAQTSIVLGQMAHLHSFPRLCLTIFLALLYAGCSHGDPQDLKEKTAHATAELKRDAKAVAGGIREGWSQYKTVDVNSATKDQLLTLPGLTAREADLIIAGRPYNQTGDLVTRHILSKKEYAKISDLLKVGKR